MMREIKFRLLFNDKIVGYEKWYPGHYLFMADTWEADPKWLYSKDGKYWNPHPPFHNFKEQFTDLHDKHGREIYEGDIVKHDYGFGNGQGVIKYLAPEFVLSTKTAFSSEFLGRRGVPLEIIGNIHETVHHEKGD